MKLLKKVGIMQRLLLLFAMIYTLQACNKSNDVEKLTKGNNIKEKGSSYSNISSCCNKALLLHSIEKATWDINSFNEVFHFLVTATNMTLSRASRTMTMVCKRIDELSNEQSAFKLYDSLLEHAISQEVTIKEYNRRQNWFAELWDVAWRAFIRAQSKQGNNFEYWDKIFMFYQKYINEILEVERTLAKTPLELWSRQDSQKGTYLYGIKGELKTWVRVMRDFYFPNMSKNYTTEQKDDILRRFKEVEKHTITPPHYPGGRAQGVY